VGLVSDVQLLPDPGRLLALLDDELDSLRAQADVTRR
jgi:hypothetical protein